MVFPRKKPKEQSVPDLPEQPEPLRRYPVNFPEYQRQPIAQPPIPQAQPQITLEDLAATIVNLDEDSYGWLLVFMLKNLK